MIFFMTTCDKDGPVEDPQVIPQDTSFCGYINDEKFENTRWYIDSFLSTISITDPTPMDKIKDWFHKEKCVVEVKYVCCILFITPMVDYLIRIKTIDGGFINLHLMIILSDPPKLVVIRKQ